MASIQTSARTSYQQALEEPKERQKPKGSKAKERQKPAQGALADVGAAKEEDHDKIILNPEH